MERHKYCPDENGVCQHGDDMSCPALEETEARDAARYRAVRANWDKLTGYTCRDPGPWLDAEADRLRQ